MALRLPMGRSTGAKLGFTGLVTLGLAFMCLSAAGRAQVAQVAPGEKWPWVAYITCGGPLHFGVEEHPFATYVDVHQGDRVLSHGQMTPPCAES